jgi:rod shape determining protein RodA
MIKIFRKRQINFPLWIFLGTVLLLTILGILNLNNADYYTGGNFHQDQLLWIVIGYVLSIVVAFIDLSIFERSSVVFYIFMITLLVLVLLFGKEVNNARRWFSFGIINFQPSEFTKIAIIMILARYFHREKKGQEHFTLLKLLKPIGFITLPFILILLEPDLGTSLVVVFVGFSIILFEGIKLRSLLILFGVVLLIIPAAWEFDIIQEYQKDRVELWLNPAKYKWNVERKKKMDKSLQAEQSLWAVGSGKIFGKGSRLGTRSRLKYLPEMHTDFIAATFAEERGFAGCASLLLLFFILCYSGLRIAHSSRGKFGVLVGFGIIAMIFWQFFINAGMVTGLLPIVGLTMPFFSYGGSSFITIMIGIGFLINIALKEGRM